MHIDTLKGIFKILQSRVATFFLSFPLVHSKSSQIEWGEKVEKSFKIHFQFLSLSSCRELGKERENFRNSTKFFL